VVVGASIGPGWCHHPLSTLRPTCLQPLQKSKRTCYTRACHQGFTPWTGSPRMSSGWSPARGKHGFTGRLARISTSAQNKQIRVRQRRSPSGCEGHGRTNRPRFVTRVARDTPTADGMMGKRHAGRGEQCGRWFATRSRIAWGTCDETCGFRPLRPVRAPLQRAPAVTNATHEAT